MSKLFFVPCKNCKIVSAQNYDRKIRINIDEDLFFFFFFGDHLIFGRKNVRISDFGRRMWLNFDEDLFFFFFLILETTCFGAEITNVFQRFPRNYMCNFWWLCFIPPNNFYGFTPLKQTDIQNKLYLPKQMGKDQLDNLKPVGSQGGGGAWAPPPLGLKSIQNRTFLVLLRPIFAQKIKTAPPEGFWVPKLWRSCRDSARRTVWISDFGRKIRLNFVEDLFFWRSPVFGRKNRLNFRFRPKKPSQFRINRLNLIQEQRKFWSRSLAVVSLFQKSPPFSKSWLRACLKLQ